MKFFLSSIICYLKSGGHCFEFRSFTWSNARKSVVMCCVKCGSIRINNAFGK